MMIVDEQRCLLLSHDLEGGVCSSAASEVSGDWNAPSLGDRA